VSGEYDFEPQKGLPERLPAGETVLWQGAPSTWRLACEVFHVRLVAVWFAGLVSWSVGHGLVTGAGASAIAAAAVPTAIAGVVALGLLMGLAWLNARTTIYTITERRVVLRVGIAITKAINIPFTIVEGASLDRLPGGHGNVALSIRPPTRVPLLHMWPHARPLRLRQPEPALRCIPDAVRVAGLLAEALVRASGEGRVQPVAAAGPDGADLPAAADGRGAGADRGGWPTGVSPAPQGLLVGR
jgi:hypothetical protein